MNFTLPQLFRNLAISNFFPFPLGLRNSGVRLYYNVLYVRANILPEILVEERTAS